MGGFVNDPDSVKNWMDQTPQLRFTLTSDLIDADALARLRKKGVPFLDADASGGYPSQPSVIRSSTQRFPDALHIDLNRARRVSLQIGLLALPTETSSGRYDVSRVQEMRSLEMFGFKCQGMLSARSKLTLPSGSRGVIDIPKDSDTYAFAYP